MKSHTVPSKRWAGLVRSPATLVALFAACGGPLARCVRAGGTHRWVWRALSLFAALAPAMHATAATTLTHSSVTGGGDTQQEGGLRLHATFGEAVAGPVSAGPFRLQGGLQAMFPADGRLPRPPHIFSDGFEPSSGLSPASGVKGK